MITAQANAAAERFDSQMIEATGHVFSEYQYIRAAGPAALANVQIYGRLIDESGVAPMLEQWEKEDRKSDAGRKPLISFRAVLILYIMHMAAGSARYGDIANALYARLSPEIFNYLDIAYSRESAACWYQRVWRAMNRLLALVQPWTLPRGTFLSATEYQTALDSYSEERRNRMDALANALVHAAAKRLPQEIRDTYAGNVAIDATLIRVAGRTNPTNPALQRQNLDAMCGRYQREGNHAGQGNKTDLPGWEVETVVTVPNSPRDPESFPTLTTGITMHRPGQIKHGPLIAMQWHANLHEKRKFIFADRAYNGLKPARFQHPTRQMGYRHVNDFKKNELGKQGAIDDVILVDGCLYIKWMPANLVNATADHANGIIDDTTLNFRMAQRSPYRLQEKGRPDADGYQRFSYPDASKLMCIDPATGKRVRPSTPKTMTLNPAAPEAARIIKHLQAFEYGTAEWARWNGLRQHVESNNKYLKDDSRTDIGNPSKRRPRGYAFQLLAFAAAAAVSNIHRIVTFIQKTAARAMNSKTTERTKRRVQMPAESRGTTEQSPLRQ